MSELVGNAGETLALVDAAITAHLQERGFFARPPVSETPYFGVTSGVGSDCLDTPADERVFGRPEWLVAAVAKGLPEAQARLLQEQSPFDVLNVIDWVATVKSASGLPDTGTFHLVREALYDVDPDGKDPHCSVLLSILHMLACVEPGTEPQRVEFSVLRG